MPAHFDRGGAEKKLRDHKIDPFSKKGEAILKRMEAGQSDSKAMQAKSGGLSGRTQVILALIALATAIIPTVNMLIERVLPPPEGSTAIGETISTGEEIFEVPLDATLEDVPTVEASSADPVAAELPPPKLHVVVKGDNYRRVEKSPEGKWVEQQSISPQQMQQMQQRQVPQQQQQQGPKP